MRARKFAEKNYGYRHQASVHLVVSNKNGDDQCITGGIYSGTATNKECNMVYILGNN